MGLFSKIGKLDPLAGRAMKDTAKATASVSKLSGGKDLAAKTLAKDTNKLARATGSIKPSSASAGAGRPTAMPKPITKPGAGSAPEFGTVAHMQALRGRNKESGPVKTVAAKPSSVSGAMGSVVAAVASRKPATKPAPKPAARKPAPKPAPRPDIPTPRVPSPVKLPPPDMRVSPMPVESPPDMRKPSPMKPLPNMRKPTIGKTR